jgi:hypothetical protein
MPALVSTMPMLSYVYYPLQVEAMARLKKKQA